MLLNNHPVQLVLNGYLLPINAVSKTTTELENRSFFFLYFFCHSIDYSNNNIIAWPRLSRDHRIRLFLGRPRNLSKDCVFIISLHIYIYRQIECVLRYITRIIYSSRYRSLLRSRLKKKLSKNSFNLRLGYAHITSTSSLVVRRIQIYK